MPSCNFKPYRFRTGRAYGLSGRFRRVVMWDSGFATLKGCECACEDETPTPQRRCYWILTRSALTNVGYVQFPDAVHVASAFFQANYSEPTGNHIALLCTDQIIAPGYSFVEYLSDSVVYPAGHPTAMTHISDMAANNNFYLSIGQQTIPECCRYPEFPQP